jgi:hypothetical protein
MRPRKPHFLCLIGTFGVQVSRIFRSRFSPSVRVLWEEFNASLVESQSVSKVADMVHPIGRVWKAFVANNAN